MAKDPAFLFYPGDWLGGTLYMTMQQKGCYISLLMLQFNTGPFTLAQAEQVLSICFASDWDMIKSKFKTDGTFFWNERLKVEKELRQGFTKSRRDNALSSKKKDKKGRAYAKHMPKHMEDENINENIDYKKEGVQGEKTGIWPGTDDMGMDIPELKVGSVIQLISAAQQTQLTSEQVKLMWGAFKAQHFTGEKHYKSINEIYSHFINWSKQQKIKDGSNKDSDKGRKGGRNQGTYDFADKVAAEFAARYGRNSGKEI